MRRRWAWVALALLLMGGCGSPAVIGSIGVRARREPTSGRVFLLDVPEGLGGASAGLEPGDEVLAIDGIPVAELTARSFSRVVRGPIGTRVRLTIRRGEDVHNIFITRTPLK